MKSWRILLFAFALLLIAAPTLSARAHGHVQAGDYELVIGFRNEPAYQGEPNGLDLRVTHVASGERITGLESTLRAEIIFGGQVKELPLQPRFGEEGAYTADFLPTEAGDYTWHIFGMIADTPVDVSMTSGPETFSSIQPKSVVSFPGAEPSGSELLESSASAARMAQIALLVGGLGLLLGLAALLVALRSLRPARQNPS
ncbi:MAG: hypothetical protein GX495_01675 [Chloroflexi bacterium]|jgi:hypothetical protein|nr:hypothetical protein [Chloroflexota bacterium]